MIGHYWERDEEREREREKERKLYFVSILSEKETKGCVSVPKDVCPRQLRNPQCR